MTRTSRRARGQAIVEFSLVAPLFFFLLFSIIEFGRVVYYVQMLNNAAREGARFAIVNGADSTNCISGPLPGGATNDCDPTGERVVSRVKSFAIAIIDAGPSEFDVKVKWCATADCPDTNPIAKGDGTNARGQTVDVQVTYVYRPILGMAPVPTFNLTGGSSLVVNH